MVDFIEYRQLLVLLPTSDLDGKSKLIKYETFELRWTRSECIKISSLRTLHPSTVMKLRSFKIQILRKGADSIVMQPFNFSSILRLKPIISTGNLQSIKGKKVFCKITSMKRK